MVTENASCNSTMAPPMPAARGLKLLHREIQRLMERSIEGIQIQANEVDLFTLCAIVSGPETSPYEGGSFSLKLVFTEEYPNAAPKGSFLTTIFHPNVSPNTGEICLSTLQKDWNPNLGLEHLLLTIKSLLMTPNAESALNEMAGKMLLEDYDAFFKHAALLTSIHANSCVANNDTMNQENPSPPPLALPVGGKKAFSSSTSLADTRRKLRRL